MLPEAVLVACRFGQDTAALLLWGAAAYLRLLVPPRPASRIAVRLRRPQVTATVILAALTALRLPAEAANVGTGPADALSPGFLFSVLSGTPQGHAWGVQAGAAIVLLLTFRLPSTRGLLGVTALASGLFLVSTCMTGHGAMSEGWWGALGRTNMICHVFAAAGWIGSLGPVLLLLRMNPHRDREVGLALRRFSQAGHVAVAVVILSGIVSTALVLGRWPVDVQHPYEGLLAAKIGAVALMTGIALCNRYVAAPRAAGSPAAARWLVAGTVGELVLGTVATALVADFGLLDPGP